MVTSPIFFERNRVDRVYRGGKLFNGFFGDAPVDGFTPEEWIASIVNAMNRESLHEKEGVSKIRDSALYFDELLMQQPQDMLGSSRKMRILVKILDSAVRLPAQAHPDKMFSKKHFNSEYGKTESWIILDTRPDAKIYFGFKDGVDRKTFMAAVEESKQDKNSVERLLEYFEPKVGDVFLVPAKTAHAIGAGCMILEVQEPTDFTIQPEYWCDDYALNEQEMYLGLTKEQAVDCFEFCQAPDAKVTPETVKNSDGIKVERLIKPSNTDCFVINRITVDNAVYTIDVYDSYGVYIVTKGCGELTGADYVYQIKKGDYFFMPACLMGKFSVNGSLELVECF